MTTTFEPAQETKLSGAKTRFFNDQQFPIVVEPERPIKTFDETLEFLRDNLPTIKSQLLQYGTILFRGFPVESLEHFNRFISELKYGSFVDYVGGGSPRTKVEGRVYTSTEAPPEIVIPLHNEMSFVDNYPTHINFYCDIPSPVGGETIIGDARKIFRDVDPCVKAKFIEKGFSYISRYYKKNLILDLINKYKPGHKTWMQVMETDDKREVEKRCKENNFEWRWIHNDWLEITQKRPAVINHPVTGETVWFNQIHNFDFNPRFVGLFNYLAMKSLYCVKDTMVNEVKFMDGSPIPREDIYHIWDVLSANTVAFPWQKGDVMVMDNILAMHGRNPFKGKRRILTALTKE
jgi:alpha-ketoglutarate-dependent taurine dioxygenase